ncbi:hypothetical protein EVAR_43223_1 [Eumeta japonica]|uniref:Uncharacterized protein n=1 Tax=Eumeta variegata TaxID=151549 RepID=A0A4C1WS34_EUMVA|nr:hypothetical protein EVAR_43223_1 [Eumeta japonica]
MSKVPPIRRQASLYDVCHTCPPAPRLSVVYSLEHERAARGAANSRNICTVCSPPQSKSALYHVRINPARLYYAPAPRPHAPPRAAGRQPFGRTAYRLGCICSTQIVCYFGGGNKHLS